MGADEESATTSTQAKEQPKRKRLFFLFGFISITWCTVLIFVMHDMRLTEHQSLQDNLDFKGADIDSIYDTESASACSMACEKHPSCLAFTYVKSEKVCWLKGEGYASKSNPNTVSGAINATLAAERRSAHNSSAQDQSLEVCAVHVRAPSSEW